MASKGKTISVIVGAITNPLEKGLKKATGLVKGFSSNASKLVAGSSGIGGAIAAAIGGVSVAAAAKLAISKFAEVETAASRLSLTLKAGGNTAGVTTQQIVGYAKQMSTTTGIAVSATLNAASVLAQAGNIEGPNFTEAITQAANYAAVIGGDVTQASGALASALKNPREGYLELAAAGVRFSDAQIDSIQSMQNAGDMAGAQSVLLQAMKDNYDGAAVAAGETLTGSLGKLWESLGAVAVMVGETLAPYVKAAVGYFQEWATSFDSIGTRNAVIEYTAKAVGWVVDGVQILNAAWKTAQVLVDGLILIAVKGFRYLAQGVQKVVAGLEKMKVVSKGTAASIQGFVDDVENFEGGLSQVFQEDATKMVKAWEKPWESKKANEFFQKVQIETKKTETAMKGMGDAVKKGPVDAMKVLSKEAIEAQSSATQSIKDMKLQLENFGLNEYDAKANELQKKGATGGQVSEMRKLGALLKGKELAQSLATPFEEFSRETAKLEKLAADGGIGGVDLDRARSALVTKLQASAPDNKVSAGGPLQAGSTEARSAVMAFRGMSRNNDPQYVIQRQTEIQTDLMKKQNEYLKKMSEAKPQQRAGVAA